VNSNDARTRVSEIARQLIALGDSRTARIILRDEFREKRAAIGERPRTPLEQRDAGLLDDALNQIERGIAREAGIAFDALRPFVGLPGLAAIERTIARLTAERDELETYLDRWPDAQQTHAFRFIGRPYKTQIAGRYLEFGDIVDLTERQAAAWSDRFEAVEPATVDA
jgi:hypothetical protein